MTEFLFGDIVVVEGNLIGVVVKSWFVTARGEEVTTHDVYMRMHNDIRNYPESEIQRYRVRHKYLDEEELAYQREG